MSLRKRLTIIAAASVAIAVLLALAIAYMVVRSQLRGQVDNSLRAQAEAIQRGDPDAPASAAAGIPASAGGPAPYTQIYAEGQRHTARATSPCPSAPARVRSPPAGATPI